MLRPLVRPIVRPLVRGVTEPGYGASPYLRLADPSMPLPAFVEGWASNSFHGQQFLVPTGLATVPQDSEGERIFNITVSGAAGATTLTGAGFNTTQGAGDWGCTIVHDDGTYGVYTASGITGTTINISPALRSTTTSKNLAAIGGSTNGQHYGLQATKALARRIYSVSNQDGYRVRYADKFKSGVDAGWDAVGGINPAVKFKYTYLSNQWLNVGAGSYFNARGRVQFTFDTAVAGQGASRTVALGGASGVLEAFVGQRTWSGAGTRVRVIVDAVTLYDETFTEFRRVLVPFTAATTGTIEITCAASAQTGFKIGDVTWWAYDRAATWSAPVIDKNATVVVMGDSWSARYSGGLGAELQAAMAGDGGSGTVTTVALGGGTAEWALEQFDSQVAPAAPDVVVIEYFVNDYNSFGSTNYNRWLNALYRLGIKCQQIGARPVFVMPLPTQSSAQTSQLGVWAELIGAGLPA